MKSGTITGLLGGVIVAGFSLGAFAEMKENPYQVIIDRNPFGLRTPPPPPEVKPPEPPPVPPLEIKLTGITTLLGPPRAILEFTDPQTKKTERPSPLEEGDSFKDIKIMSIDAENNLVRVKIGDAESTLDFIKNGVKATVAAGPAPVPHPSMAPMGLPPAPAYGQPAVNPALGQPANNSGRSIISGGANPVSAVPTGFNPAGVAANSGLPTRTVRTADTGAAIVGGYGYTPNQPNAAPVAQTASTMSREEIEARIEAQRRMLEQRGNPQSRILPPTSIGKMLNTPAPPPAP